MKRGLVVALALLLMVLMIAWVISCGGGGKRTSSSGFSGLNISVDLGPEGQNIPLVADTTWSFTNSVSFNVGDFGGPYTAITLDLMDNLPDLIFSTLTTAGLKAAVPLAPGTGSMTLFIAPFDAADPCTEGEQYGPFEITLDVSSQPESVSPETLIASQTTVDIINLGAFSICVKVTSPLDANASKDDATFTVCTEPIADMAGTWTGTFYCTGNCPIGSPAEPEIIDLHITQTPGSPGYANYTDDGGAFYSGNVCGYTFSFEGGGPTYDESGIFTVDSEGLTATKKSYYVEHLPGTCRGDCYDTLTRVVDE